MRGTMLACAGTQPVSNWRDAKMASIQRYAELVEQMQWLARRIQTFGVHVHVGLRDGSKAIPIVNALATYLPHFPGADRVGPVLGWARHGARAEPGGQLWWVAGRRSAAHARGLD
jgi:glutamate---cysteine ligase / carboxylate-amine ligase